MECSEALDLLFDSFDGQITPAQQSLLDGHRRTCFACAHSMIKAERFQDLLRHVPQLTVPRGLEERIINRVVSKTGATMSSSENVLSFVSYARTNWRPVLSFGGVLAAAIGAIIYFQNVNAQANTGQPLLASVQGALETINDHQSTEVANAPVDITTGSTVANTSIQAAVVALTAHLKMTIEGGAQVHFNRIATDPKTGNVNEIEVHVDRGAIQVHEDLNHEASPIKVATDQATIVPTGTTFQVEQRLSGTHVVVNKGSVAVYLPGRVLNVLAGQGLQVLANGGVLRDKPTKKSSHKGTTTSDILTR